MEQVPAAPLIEHVLGEYGWILIFGFIVLLFKNTLESIIAGIFIFAGNDLNDDDVVYVNGEKGRIVRKSPWSTTFYMYEVGQGGQIIGVRKMVVANTELKTLRIAKPLPKLDLSKEA